MLMYVWPWNEQLDRQVCIALFDGGKSFPGVLDCIKVGGFTCSTQLPGEPSKKSICQFVIPIESWAFWQHLWYSVTCWITHMDDIYSYSKKLSKFHFSLLLSLVILLILTTFLSEWPCKSCSMCPNNIEKKWSNSAFINLFEAVLFIHLYYIDTTVLSVSCGLLVICNNNTVEGMRFISLIVFHVIRVFSSLIRWDFMFGVDCGGLMLRFQLFNRGSWSVEYSTCMSVWTQNPHSFFLFYCLVGFSFSCLSEYSDLQIAFSFYLLLFWLPEGVSSTLDHLPFYFSY